MPARSPEDCDRLFAECANSGDLKGLVALYEPRGSLVRVDGGLATGHDAIHHALDELTAMEPQLRMNIVRVVKVGDDLAVLYNDWTMSGKGPDGQPLEMAGKAVEVVRRQADGTWRFAVDDPFARG
jgi:uncharacterized protein (TIGR02246 family)